jgi:hypothetical protein
VAVLVRGLVQEGGAVAVVGALGSTFDREASKARKNLFVTFLSRCLKEFLRKKDI